MAQFAAPAHLRDDPTVILVAHDEKGEWSVFNNQELMEATFADREDALRFARLLRASQPGSIIIEPTAEVASAYGEAAPPG